MVSMFSDLSQQSLKASVFAHIVVTSMVTLCVQPASAQTIKDEINKRTHDDDYRARKKRARAEDKFIDERRRAAMEEELERDKDRDREDQSDKPMPNADQESDDSSAGLRFNKSTFIDSDFSKDDFTDLLLNGTPKPGDKDFAPSDQADLSKTNDSANKSADLGDSDHGSDLSLHADKTKDDRKKRDRDSYISSDSDSHFDELSQLFKGPPPMGPNDWVPDKLDPISNGGFTLAPDNGSPVPYRLNGHVDLERDVPWLHDQ